MSSASSTVVYEGWMVRHGRRKIGFSFIHMRYFVLETRQLSYFERQPKHKVPPIRSVKIDGNFRVEDRGLKMHKGHMIYVLCVYNKRERDNRITMAAFNIQEALIWKEKIEMVIHQHQGVVLPDGNAAYSSSQQKASIENGSESSFSDCDSEIEGDRNGVEYILDEREEPTSLGDGDIDMLEHILDGKEEPTNLPFFLLKKITGNFSEKHEIGQGGFGTVYKGVLPNGNVAVKRIMNTRTIDENLFYREVNSMLKVNHPNVVRFLGYCANTEQKAMKVDGATEYIYAEMRERLLCFEFISNGSLQKHITDELRGLEWNTRYQIIKGICEGLHYLHMEKHIIHMDLKPGNILLDSHLVPKITDFGLSRTDEKSHTTSADRCVTRGYCAPEYLLGGRMSVRSDIYSLGVIIIELVTGHKGIPDQNNVLRRWRHRWNRSKKETPLGYQQVTKCIKLGILCMDHDPYKRPFIRDIILGMNELEGNNGLTGNIEESPIGQITPYVEDDMLGIKPLELHFSSELNREMSCSLRLTNETNSYIAFEVLKMSPLPYCTKPQKGIVPPRTKCNVDITLQPQDKVPQRADEFIVRSTKVNYATKDVNSAMFSRDTGNVVDEVSLEVVFDQRLQTGSGGIVQKAGADPEITHSQGWFLISSLVSKTKKWVFWA